jgi:23S rRNA (cytidine1920-2'-O)/16S rRNA (cytidine1409-2'-O)-methyltransferase
LLKGQRLDERLVADGLAPTRSRAEGLIRAGQVLVDETCVDKPGARVRSQSRVRLRSEARRFVSRGGEKLAGALVDLAIDPAGKSCLDVGASTGGFTDCLLAAGARRVVVDVGYDARAEAARGPAWSCWNAVPAGQRTFRGRSARQRRLVHLAATAPCCAARARPSSSCWSPR